MCHVLYENNHLRFQKSFLRNNFFSLDGKYFYSFWVISRVQPQVTRCWVTENISVGRAVLVSRYFLASFRDARLFEYYWTLTFSTCVNFLYCLVLCLQGSFVANRLCHLDGSLEQVLSINFRIMPSMHLVRRVC